MENKRDRISNKFKGRSRNFSFCGFEFIQKMKVRKKARKAELKGAERRKKKSVRQLSGYQRKRNVS